MREPFTGSLEAMFSSVMAHVESTVDPVLWAQGLLHSEWLEYTGPDCSPFKCYTRFGHDMIVLANILGMAFRKDENVIRKGRMPHIIAACFKVRPLLYVESVVSPDLRRYLEYTGFVVSPEYHLTYYKRKDSDE